MSTNNLARSQSTVTPVASDPIIRLCGVASLAGMIWIHLLDVRGKLAEVPYIGVGYIVLMLGAAAAAVLLASRSIRLHRAGWALGAALALGTIVGFVLTRTTGLPRATEDKGNWGEAIGVWSLAFEGSFLMLALIATRSPLARRHQLSAS